MSISEHIDTFAGLPVREFDGSDLSPGSEVAWRVSTDFEENETFAARLEALVGVDHPEQVTALVIGEWGDSYDSAIIDRLVSLADRLSGLRALFVGEMTYEECEISWINQGDVTPLLRAYPRLEVLRVRGSSGLGLEPLRHDSLRELAFESGGLPAHIVRAVGECDLPALRHLELWLGTDNYGGDADIEDLAAILAGSRFPALEHLGLRDAEIADAVAAALAGAPVVARLTGLDLSLGMLSDTGAAALLAGQPLTHLRTLDLHHHFLSAEMMAHLRAELPTVTLDLSDANEEDDDRRFIAVSE